MPTPKIGQLREAGGGIAPDIACVACLPTSGHTTPMQEVRWYRYEMRKRSGKKALVGDRCHSCSAWVKKHLSWMSFEDAVALCERDSKFVAEAMPCIKSYAPPDDEDDASDFPAEDVCQKVFTGICVQRQGILLDKAEFNEKFKSLGPDAWDRCGIQPTMCMNEHGKRSQAIIVRDESAPYRKVMAYTFMGDERSTYKLMSSDHVFASQGSRLMSSLTKDRRTKAGSEMQAMTSPKPFPTLAELEDNIQNGAAAAADAGGDADSDDEQVVVDSAGKVVEGAAMATPQKSGAMSSARSSHGGGVGLLKLARAGMLGSGKKSVAASTYDDGDGEEGLNRSAAHWIGKMNLTAIMAGTKMGREKGFATKARDRMYNMDEHCDARALDRHLKLVRYAENLTAKRIETIEEPELVESVEKMVEASADFPSAVKLALWTRRVKAFSPPPPRHRWGPQGHEELD